jgi:hypothetical protein
MDTTRPLHDVFSGLAGADGGAEPADVLRANGHEALPDGLVAEAVVTYADTAPIEVAEHLSAFVQANSPVPRADAGIEPPTWLDALTTAPAGTDIPGEPDPGSDLDEGVDGLTAAGTAGWDPPSAPDDSLEDTIGDPLEEGGATGFGAGDATARGAADASDEALRAEPEHGFSHTFDDLPVTAPDPAGPVGATALGAGSGDDLDDDAGYDADPADLDDL